jgi:hypothetical protein
MDSDHLLRLITYSDLESHWDRGPLSRSSRVVPIIIAEKFTEYDRFVLSIFDRSFGVRAFQLDYEWVGSNVVLRLTPVACVNSFGGDPTTCTAASDRRKFEAQLLACLAAWRQQLGTVGTHQDSPALTVPAEVGLSPMQCYRLGILCSAIASASFTATL